MSLKFSEVYELFKSSVRKGVVLCNLLLPEQLTGSPGQVPSNLINARRNSYRDVRDHSAVLKAQNKPRATPSNPTTSGPRVRYEIGKRESEFLNVLL